MVIRNRKNESVAKLEGFSKLLFVRMPEIKYRKTCLSGKTITF